MCRCRHGWFSKENLDFSWTDIKISSQWPIFVEAFPAFPTSADSVASKTGVDQIAYLWWPHNLKSASFGYWRNRKQKVYSNISESLCPIVVVLCLSKISIFSTLRQVCVVDWSSKTNCTNIVKICEQNQVRACRKIGRKTYLFVMKCTNELMIWWDIDDAPYVILKLLK